MSVDLPEPEGPISATNSPRSTVMSIPRRAWTAAPFAPKTFVRPEVLMMADMACSFVVSFGCSRDPSLRSG